MRKKYYLTYFEIINNSRLTNLGMKEVKLNIGDRRLIGFVGDNGSGKSTILEEIQPLAIYNYVENEVGKKYFVYEREDKEEELRITFLFEPKNDTSHSCKIYITKVQDYNKEELNPNGSFNNGVDLINSLLGFNSNIALIYSMTATDIFFVNKSVSERYTILQKAISGLEQLRKTATLVAEKNRAVTTVLKATNKKLEGMSDLILLENQLNEHMAKVDELEKDFENLTAKIASMDISEDKINKVNNNIKINNSKLKDIQSVVLPYYINNYNDDEEFIISQFRHTLKLEISALQFRQDTLIKDIMTIESELNNIKLKEKLNVDYSEIEYKNLSEYFSKFSKEEKEKILGYSVDTLHHVKRLVEDISLVFAKLRLNEFTFEEIVSNHETSLISINSSLLKRGGELVELRKRLENKLNNNAYVTKLVNSIDLTDEKCKTSCNLVNAIFKVDSDLDNIEYQISEINEELSDINDRIRSNEALVDISREYQSARNYYLKNTEIMRKYIPDFNFESIIRNGNINELKIIIASCLNDHNNLIKLMKIEEGMKYQSIIDSYHDNDINTKKDKILILKKELETNKKLLEEYTKKRAEIDSIINILDVTKKGYDLTDYLSYNHNRLNSELNALKVEQAHLIEVLNEMEFNLELKENEEVHKNNIKSDIINRRDEIDKIRDIIGSIRMLTEDSKKYTYIQDELSILHNITSKKLFSKVIMAFLLGLQERANGFLSRANLPYRIETPVVSDTELKMPVHKLNSNVTSIDISAMSSGEKCNNGMVVSMSCQDMLDIPYNTVCLDEVDGPLSPRRRIEFMSIINSCVNETGKQIFCISQNNNFSLYKENIGLVVLRDGEVDAGADVIYNFNR